MIPRRLALPLALFAACGMVSPSSLAQEAADAEGSAEEAAPPPPPPPPGNEVPVSDAARQHFRTGVAYMQDPDGARYEEAYAEFKAAYADSPSWKILGNLGIAAMKLERDGEAVWAFEKYLEEGGDRIDPAERTQMERDLTTVKAGLTWVVIQTDPPGAYIIDERQPPSGRAVVNRYEAEDGEQRIGVRRGHHKFTARMEGYEPSAWEVDLEPGQEYTHTFKLEVPSEPVAGGPAAPVIMERPIPIPVYITAGATVVLLAGAGVTGFMALDKNSEYADVNDGLESDYAEDLKGQGETLNLVTDILLGGAVVAGAVTTILYVTRPEVPVRDTASLRIAPSVGPGGGGVSLAGKF